MKNILTTILVLFALVVNAQSDTVTYWYSSKQAKYRKEQGCELLKSPCGDRYTCFTSKYSGCGNFDDMYVVCRTIGDEIIEPNHIYSFAHSFKNGATYITSDTLIMYYYKEQDTFKVVVLITDDGRRLEMNFSDEAQKFEGIINNTKGVDRWYSLRNKYELIVYVGKAFNVKKVVEDITKQCAKGIPYVIEYIEEHR